MSPRIGRPKLDNPKNIDVTVRITSEMNDRLLEYAKTHNQTRVEVIRKGIEIVLGSEKNKKQPPARPSTKGLFQYQPQEWINLLYHTPVGMNRSKDI